MAVTDGLPSDSSSFMVGPAARIKVIIIVSGNHDNGSFGDYYIYAS